MVRPSATIEASEGGITIGPQEVPPCAGGFLSRTAPPNLKASALSSITLPFIGAGRDAVLQEGYFMHRMISMSLWHGPAGSMKQMGGGPEGNTPGRGGKVTGGCEKKRSGK